MSAPDRIEQIKAGLAPLQPLSMEVADDSHLHAGHAGAGGGGHFRLTITSPQFAGKSTLERHRMVYSALHELMQHEIHALNIRAFTPDEAQS